MIITDLNYMESTEINVAGAGGYSPKYPVYYPVPFVSKADAYADAKAFGGAINIAYTDTFAAAGPGFATASSKSSAASAGTTYYGGKKY